MSCTVLTELKLGSVRRGRCKERHEMSVACYDRATHQFSFFLNPDSEHSMLSDSFQVFWFWSRSTLCYYLSFICNRKYLFFMVLHGISYRISAVSTRPCMVSEVQTWSPLAGAAAAATKYNRRHGQQKWPACMILVVVYNIPFNLLYIIFRDNWFRCASFPVFLWVNLLIFDGSNFLMLASQIEIFYPW
jgi:hypothetical protein